MWEMSVRGRVRGSVGWGSRRVGVQVPESGVSVFDGSKDEEERVGVESWSRFGGRFPSR